MYSLFKVYDYKGGELSTTINISKEQLLGELLDSRGCSWKYNECKDEGELEAWLSGFEFQEGIYAGCEYFVGAVYEHVEGKLVKVDVQTFVPELKDLMREYWREDNV